MRRLLFCLLLTLSGAAQAAERVVTLAPSLTEIVVELGAAERLVGVLDAGVRPAALRGVPSVGRYGQVDMERLLSLKPDLLLLWPGSIGPAQRNQLQRLGIPTYVVAPQTLEQLGVQLQAIGEQIGHPEQGRELATTFARQLAALRQRYARVQPLRVFYQVWDQPLYTVGGGQIISDAIEVCGGRNVFANLDQPAPLVSLETVLQSDPQVILAGSPAQLDAWRAWPQLAAVRQQRLLVVPDNGLERPSAQMLAATAKLCAVMAPER